MSTYGAGESEFDILFQVTSSEVGLRFRELVWYFENQANSEYTTTQNYAAAFLACLHEATESQVKVFCEIISLLKNQQSYSLPALLIYHGLMDEIKSFEKMGLQLSPEDKMRFWPDYYSFSNQDIEVSQYRLMQYKQVMGLQPQAYNAPFESSQYPTQQAEIDLAKIKEREELEKLIEENKKLKAEFARVKEEKELKELEELKKLEAEIAQLEGSFFLPKLSFPQVYEKDEARYQEYKAQVEQGIKPPKEVREPVEQLSARGLALLSYIYSEIDKSEKQPIISDSVSSLRKMAKLIDNSPVGTQVTLIFQPVEKDSVARQEDWEKYFSGGHKTVLKFEKTAKSVRVISMDGTSNGFYRTLPQLEIDEALIANAKEHSKPPSHLDFYQGNIFVPGKEKADYRQKNSHECGIFATKDARELNRDPNFYEKYLSQDVKVKSSSRDGCVVSYDYILPTPYLKSYQSTTALQSLFQELDPSGEVRGNTIVTRSGKTLIEKFDEVGDTYTYHFSKKYHDRVTRFLNENTPEHVEAVASRYMAHAMTLDRLIEVYGPPVSRKAPIVASYHHHQAVQQEVKQDVQKEEKISDEKSRSLSNKQ